MSFRRTCRLVALAAATLLCISCGQVYRPVVIPVSTTPPYPAGFHEVFGISNNIPFNQGTAMQIDVSGDTNIGVANMGVNPTHAGILPNNTRVFVASSGSLSSGEADAVMAFTPAGDTTVASGLGNPVTISLPYGSLPVFVTTTQTSAVYVANFGTNSVSALSTSTNAVTMTESVGSQPIALAETPNALNLYVLNQGDNTLTDLSPVDLSTLATIPIGNTPVWAVSRADSQRLYVLTQGDGLLHTLRTDTNAIVGSQSVGVGANFILYDSNRSRLYVTSPATSSFYVFDVTTDPPTPIMPAGSASPAIGLPLPSPCGGGITCSGVTPVSVSALPDGSRFYVASYVTASPCPDPNVGNLTPTDSCMIPQLTVFQAASLTVKPMPSSSSLLSPSLSLLSSPQFGATQYAVRQVSTCVPAPSYSPSSTRFRMFTTAAADSSHVYVSLCDAGMVADVAATTSTVTTGGSNTPDTLAADIPTPFAACTGSSCPTPANITGFSITSNVVTFQAANNFFPGEQVSISGLSTGTSLNGLTLTILATGLSSSSFECMLSGTNQDVPQTTDSGSAVPLPVQQTPIFLLSGF
ncbi:MAG TPA: YncE family protein [Candidatus Sulfotelmatobacter sp.]|nr:YncE family protein [Candidatus Sulfotelmatobacter sp.]